MLAPRNSKALSKLTFIIIDDNQNHVLKTKAVAESFQGLEFVASAANYEDGLDAVLEHRPAIVFLATEADKQKSDINLSLINEFYRYLTQVPKVIITSSEWDMAFEAIKLGVYDYLIQPIQQKDVRKTLARLNRDLGLATPLASNILFEEKVIRDLVGAASEDFPSQTHDVMHVEEDFLEEEATENNNSQPEEEVKQLAKKPLTEPQNAKQAAVAVPVESAKPLVICVKSYGDYRYIQATDICYLQADNNSTDIHLHTGEMITAFKTLKHFEGVLDYPFVRIHNSYIVNSDYVSRIHTGNAVCHIKDSANKLPFSKSYKENIDAMISTIASGNYLEI